jgi:hypothetical protein
MDKVRKDRLNRAIAELMSQYEDRPITDELMDDVAQEVELLVRQHVPTRPAIKVTRGPEPGSMKVSVSAVLTDPKRRA